MRGAAGSARRIAALAAAGFALLLPVLPAGSQPEEVQPGYGSYPPGLIEGRDPRVAPPGEYRDRERRSRPGADTQAPPEERPYYGAPPPEEHAPPSAPHEYPPVPHEPEYPAPPDEPEHPAPPHEPEHPAPPHEPEHPAPRHEDHPRPTPEDYRSQARDRASGVADDHTPPYYGPTRERPRPSQLETQRRLQGLGTQVRDDGDDPRDVPVDDPHLGPPPPVIYGEELEDPFVCCGMTGDLITYPVISDPMELPAAPEAPRDVAVGGFQVLLHNGAFVQNEVDLANDAVALPFEWTRHWKGQVKYREGGLIGHGWDFSYNKRIVPIGTTQLGNGLWSEVVGTGSARLQYHNGMGRAELYTELHSEARDVVNFDRRFRAYVTTYKSPPGQFHEIERYILLGDSPHPFIGKDRPHPNIEANERIFYVLREKNGTRYVFNCRGQLIYILSRNDENFAPAKWVRVELWYRGAINPLTHNPMLSDIFDPTGHHYSVESTVEIGQASFKTNMRCRLVASTLPIPRISKVSGRGVEVTYRYRNGNREPVLEDMVVTTGAISRQSNYRYDANHNLTELRDPNECAKPGQGKPYLTNYYDGQGRVFSQDSGGTFVMIRYQGDEVAVEDANRVRKIHRLGKAGGYPVRVSERIEGQSGRWETHYAHNAATQVTRITYPKGNGIAFTYDEANEPVTRGPIRDWADRGITYENNLSEGNLTAVTRFSATGETITASMAYDPLYNQTTSLVDAMGKESRITIGADAQGTRGNPLTIQEPDVEQPDGSVKPRPTVSFAYNYRGQRISTTIGDRTTSFTFDPRSGFLAAIKYPGTGFETFIRNARGAIVRHTTHAGTVDYVRDARDLIVEEIRDPGGLETRTRMAYDLNGNLIETRHRIEDQFSDADARSLGISKAAPQDRVVTTVYDIVNRPVLRRMQAGALHTSESFVYGPTGALVSTSRTAPAGTGQIDTRYRYNEQGLLSELWGDGPATTYVHDANGNLSEVRIGGSGGPVLKRTYDGFDRMTEMIDQRGSRHLFAYDAASRITRYEVQGRLGRGGAQGVLKRTEYAYDAYDNVIRQRDHSLDTGGVFEIQWFYSPLLLVERTRGPDGGEYRFGYDDENRLVRVVDPVGDETVTRYGPTGEPSSVEEWMAVVTSDGDSDRFETRRRALTTRYERDGLNRVVRMVTPNDTRETFFDSGGNVRAVRSTLEGTSTFAYDGLGRPTRVANGEFVRTTHYWPGGVVREVQDQHSHQLIDSDPSGRTTRVADRRAGTERTMRYDRFGRIERESNPDGSVIAYGYHPTGDLASLTVTPGRGTVAAGDGRAVPTFGGARRHDYDYDGLGRVVRAATEQGSEVRLAYDGLGRVVEDAQTLQDQTQSVRKRYAPDFRSRETDYPELAQAKLTWTLDPLGRVETIDLDGNQLAAFVYSGRNRVGHQAYANGVETFFAYWDSTALPSRIWSVRGAGTPNAQVLARTWLDYERGRLKRLTHDVAPDAPTPLPRRESEFSYDPLGRVTATQVTEQLIRPGQTPQPVSQRGSYSTYVDGQLASSIDYAVDPAAGAWRMARRDVVTRDGAGRVTSTATTGLPRGGGTAPATVTPAAVQALLTDSGDAISDSQRFEYDAAGRLVSDGRYIYQYDFRGNVTRIEDRLAPYGYHESHNFRYDALGRLILSTPARDRAPGATLVSWAPPWHKPEVWRLYDGNSLVAEVTRHEEGASARYSLLARYFHGVAFDHLIRIDRRDETAPNSPTIPFYVHEDGRGSIQFLTNSFGEQRFVRNLDPSPGSAPAAAFRPPGDRNLIDGTTIRVPYVARGVRIDGFAGSAFSDMGGIIHDFRAASGYVAKADQQTMRDEIAHFQARATKVLAAMTAVPLGAATLGPLAAEGAAKGMMIGIGATTATEVGATYGSGGELDRAGLLAGLVRGAYSGAASGAVGGAISAFGIPWYAGIGADLATGLAFDVGVAVGIDEVSIGDALANATRPENLAFSIGGSVVPGLANRSFTWLSALSVDPRVANGLPSGIRRSEVVRYRHQSGRAADRERINEDVLDLSRNPTVTYLNRSAKHDLLENQILAWMENGTKLSKEIARRLRSGELVLRMEEGGSDGAYGYMYPQKRNVIFLNLDTVKRHPITRRWLARDAASTVVHEGIHCLGGGEVAAHIGQSQFLFRSGVAPWAIRGMKGYDWSKSDVPDLTVDSLDALRIFARHDFRAMEAYVLQSYHPSMVRMPNSFQLDDWVHRQPGGLRKLLGFRDVQFDIQNSNVAWYLGGSH